MTDAAFVQETPAQQFIGVAEAARLLGVSRSFAYDMANLWIATNGAEGLPAVRLGRRLLVKRSALERWSDEPSRR